LKLQYFIIKKNLRKSKS